MRPFLLPVATSFCLAVAISSGLAQQVGVSVAVDQSAKGTPPGAGVRTITIGGKIVHNERIDTDAVGLLQILLADGTTFTVGPNSRLTIDSFVYDPDRGTAKISASLGKGFFRFIGGRTSKTPNGVRLKTPVGTVGIRGAIADFRFASQHKGPSHIDLLYGDRIVLSASGQPTERLYTSGYSIVITSDGKREIRPTPRDWLTSFEAMIGGRKGKHGGANGRPTESMVTSIARSNSDLSPSANTFPIPLAQIRDPVAYATTQSNHDVRNTLSSP